LLGIIFLVPDLSEIYIDLYKNRLNSIMIAFLSITAFVFIFFLLSKKNIFLRCVAKILVAVMGLVYIHTMYMFITVGRFVIE